MDEFESLSHTKWECKYHVVFIPKFRRKALYGQLRDHLGELFRKISGREDISSRPWGETKLRSGNTSRARKRKIRGWSN
jgi:putative transposase